MDYRLDQLKRKFNIEDDGQKVAFLQEAARMLATLPSAVEREIYGGHAAQMAGVSADAVALEVKKAFRQRLRKEEKQQERRDLTPAVQLQPRARALRYENLRSARAEEGMLRLLLVDPALLTDMGDLRGEEFSSPLLGRVFNLLAGRIRQGLSPGLAGLAGELTPEEMDHLAYVAGQPEDLSNGRQAAADYIALIRDEGLRRQASDGDDLLRAAQQRLLKKKAYNTEENT